MRNPVGFGGHRWVHGGNRGQRKTNDDLRAHGAMRNNLMLYSTLLEQVDNNRMNYMGVVNT